LLDVPIATNQSHSYPTRLDHRQAGFLFQSWPICRSFSPGAEWGGMECLADASHEAGAQWITAVNEAGFRHTLQALYCPECNRAWLPLRKSDGTEGVAALDMSVWAKSLGPEHDVPGRFVLPDFGPTIDGEFVTIRLPK
jgi:hypothetical protein